MTLSEAKDILAIDEQGLRSEARMLDAKMAESNRRPSEIRKLKRDRDIANDSAEAIRVVLATIAELGTTSRTDELYVTLRRARLAYAEQIEDDTEYALGQAIEEAEHILEGLRIIHTAREARRFPKLAGSS